MPYDDNGTDSTVPTPASGALDGGGAGDAGERASFLLELADAIWAAAGAEEVLREALHRVRAWLQVDRVLWVRFESGAAVVAWDRSGGSDGALEGGALGDALPGVAEALGVGRSMLEPSDAEAAGHARPGWANAALAVPVVQDGQTVAALVAATAQERQWEDVERELCAQIAARVWHELQRMRSAQDLREREERYRFLVESAHEYAIFMIDEGGRITSWNAGAKRIFGYSADEALGRPLAMIFTPEDRDRDAPQHEMSTAAETGRASDERWHLRKDGERFWASGVMESLRAPDGTLRGFAKVLRDNTRRRDTEQALARERARLDTVLELLPVAVAIADADGRIERDNAAARELWGVPLDTQAASWLDYENFVAWWPETGERVAAHEWAMTRAVRHGHETRDELILNQKFESDERRYFLNNVVPIRDADGTIAGGVAAMVDVTERLDAERALQEYRDRLEDLVEERTREVRELASHLSRVEQQERARIAQVLHDSVQQHLHAVQAKHGLVLSMLRESAAVPEDVALELTEAQEWTRDAIRVTRSLAVDLNPPVLRQHGLGRALSWLTSQMEGMHGLQVELTSDDEGDRLPWEVRLVAYQLVRELLFNIVKHANTDQARVSVADEGSHVAIRVEDEGSGFVVPGVGSGAPGVGLGLASVRERIHYLGGELQLESRPGRGTCVRMRIPSDRAHGPGDDADEG